MEEEKYDILDEETSLAQVTILLYGQSGVGKTFLAAQTPGPLFLTCDTGQYGGVLSARQFKPKYVKISSYSQFQCLLPFLEKDAGKEFKTLILDSSTSFQKIIMKSILSLTSREIARFEDWNLCVERMRTAVNFLGALNSHLIITATEQLIRDELLGKLIGGPNLPGKLAQELPAAVDIALHLYTRTGFDKSGRKTVTYLMSSAPDEIWVGKDRTGTLPVECPTSFEILKPLFKELINEE